MADTKQCKTCGKIFYKKVNVSRKKWATMKYCSNPCINKGRISKFRGLRPMPEERKQHLREVLKGRTTNTGKTHFKKGNKIGVKTQFKKGNITWNTGKKNPYFTGPNNPNWKGGITPEHKKIRWSLKYKKFREEIFKRDNYTCQECGRKRKKGDRVILNAHHKKSFTKYKELRFVKSNVITLCQECHKKKHSKN